MDIKAYERVWVRGLTPRMRKLLIWVAQHEHHEPLPQWANGNTAKALRLRGYITTYPYRLTNEGIALIQVNAAHVVMNPPADKLTEAPTRPLMERDVRIAYSELTPDDALATAEARIRELEAALRKIIERAPDAKPVKDGEYNWDRLEGREKDIASSAHIYGEGMAWWYAAEIAADALGRGE